MDGTGMFEVINRLGFESPGRGSVKLVHHENVCEKRLCHLGSISLNLHTACSGRNNIKMTSPVQPCLTTLSVYETENETLSCAMVASAPLILCHSISLFEWVFVAYFHKRRHSGRWSAAHCQPASKQPIKVQLSRLLTWHFKDTLPILQRQKRLFFFFSFLI